MTPENLSPHNKQEEKTDKLIFPEDELLQRDCEEAFRRLRFQAPAPEVEWERLNARIDNRKKRLVRIAFSVAAVFAGVMFLLFYKPASPTNDGKMAVLVESKPENPSPVIEEEALGGKTTVVLPLRTKRFTDVKGTVYSAQEADYTKVSSEVVHRSVVSIPRGKVYKITLNDGTEVWLNASSRLSFPTRFTDSRREVTLDGEAYFKVAPDKQHPFVVIAGKVETEVLGTEFNVKAYPDADFHVTLVRGSVKVHLPQTGGEALLHPGNDITCTADSYFIQQVDISYYTQWMEGYFYYDDVLLTDILRDLGRWYNVTIAMEQDSFLMSQRLHFVADRHESIAHVVENLNRYQYLSAVQDGNRIVIRRKTPQE